MLANNQKKKADLHDVNIQDANNGIIANDVDFVGHNIDISNVKKDGIVSDGKGNFTLVGGRISHAGGTGIRIGPEPSRTDEIMQEIQKFIENQVDTTIKTKLNRHIEQYHKTLEQDEKKAILKDIVQQLIQKGFGAFIGEIGKRFGDAFPLS